MVVVGREEAVLNACDFLPCRPVPGVLAEIVELNESFCSGVTGHGERISGGENIRSRGLGGSNSSAKKESQSGT